MVTYNRFISGLTEYIDNEILVKITGYQKWLFGTIVGVSLSKATNIFNMLKSNSFVKALELVDKDDNIDVDTLYSELKKQASKGAVTFDVPMLGSLTLTEMDVDKLYNYIKKPI